MGSITGWRLRIVNFSSLVRQGDGMSYMAICGEVSGGRTSTKTLVGCSVQSQEWQETAETVWREQDVRSEVVKDLAFLK